jgi:hypothetical protein
MNQENIKEEINSGMITNMSSGGKNFLKKFLWRIIYDFRFKDEIQIQNKDILTELLDEINKAKLEEITFKNKKFLKFNKGGKDIIVNL